MFKVTKKSSSRTPMDGQGSAGRPLEMGAENEEQLADYLFACGRCRYGLSHREILQLAGEFLRDENIKTRWVNGTPGPDWLKNFLRRHPQVVTHKDEVWSTKQPNPFDVHGFYRELDHLYEEEGVTTRDSHRIYSLLEISLSCDEEQTKEVNILQDGDRLNASVLTCICADGGRLPPLVVFQGDCVPFTRNKNVTSSRKSSDDQIMFCYWFENVFIPMLPKAEKSTILFLEGQSFFINLRVLREARRSNVFFVKFPPKMADNFQPLDSKYSFDLKYFYNKEFQEGIMNFNVKDNRREKFGNIVATTWEKFVNMNTIVKGFEKTGLFPLDKDKFDDSEILEPSSKKFKGDSAMERKINIYEESNSLSSELSNPEGYENLQAPKITHVASVASFGVNDTAVFSKEEKLTSFPSAKPSETVMTNEIFRMENKELFSVELQLKEKELADKKTNIDGKVAREQNGDKVAINEVDDKGARYQIDDKSVRHQDNDKGIRHQDDDKSARPQDDDKSVRHQDDEISARPQDDDKSVRHQDDDGKDVKHQDDEKSVRPQDDDKSVRHQDDDGKDVKHQDNDKGIRHQDDDKGVRPQDDDKSARPQDDDKGVRLQDNNGKDVKHQDNDGKDVKHQDDDKGARHQDDGKSARHQDDEKGVTHQYDKIASHPGEVIKTAKVIANRRCSEPIFKSDNFFKLSISSIRKTI